MYACNDDHLVGTKAESLSLARIDEFTGHGQILLFTAFPEYVLSFFKDRAYLGIVLYYLTIAAIGLPSAVSFKIVSYLKITFLGNKYAQNDCRLRMVSRLLLGVEALARLSSSQALFDYGSTWTSHFSMRLLFCSAGRSNCGTVG